MGLRSPLPALSKLCCMHSRSFAFIPGHFPGTTFLPQFPENRGLQIGCDFRALGDFGKLGDLRKSAVRRHLRGRVGLVWVAAFQYFFVAGVDAITHIT